MRTIFLYMIVMFCMMTAAIGCLYVIAYIPSYDDQRLQASSEVTIPQPCNYLDLPMTAQCLFKQVNSTFQYKLSDDKERTWEEVQRDGGDCYDYNLLYKKWFNQLGFNATMVEFPLTAEIAHVVTIAYNHNSYCIMDQNIQPVCVLLMEDENE